MFEGEVIEKVNNKPKKTLGAKIPRTWDNKVEKTLKEEEKIIRFSPEERERVIYNPYGRFTSMDDELCEVIEKKFKKDKIYYKLELLESKKTKSVGVPKVEWHSGIIYEDIPEEKIIPLTELFTY